MTGVQTCALPISEKIQTLTTTIKSKRLELEKLEKESSPEFEMKKDLEEQIVSNAAILASHNNLYIKLKDAMKSDVAEEVLEADDIFDEISETTGLPNISDFEEAVKKGSNLTPFYTGLSKGERSNFDSLALIIKNTVSIEKKLKDLYENLEVVKGTIEKFGNLKDNTTAITSTKAEIELKVAERQLGRPS